MTLADDHKRVSQNGLQLAGGPDDLTQRALVYLNLYRSSGGNHVFPLLAAHGALWASRHFKRGMRISRIFARLELLDPQRRQDRLEEVSAFANAMKDINRRVCVETYTAFHMTRLRDLDCICQSKKNAVYSRRFSFGSRIQLSGLPSMQPLRV